MEDRFRVYDYLSHEWVKDDVLISERGDMFRIKRGMFGKEYIELMSDTQYVYQLNTLCMDKYGNNIYEGDICKIESKELNCIGVVIYNGMNATYNLFCDDGEYYAFMPVLTQHMSIVGNTFDNQGMLEHILMNVEKQ